MSAVDPLAVELANARAELARADQKASILLPSALGALAIVAAAATTTQPWPVIAFLAVAGAASAGAAILLLTAVRPVLTGRHGVVGYAQATSPEDVASAVQTGREWHAASELWWLARQAVRRYRLLRWATDLLRVALLAGAVAAAGGLLS